MFRLVHPQSSTFVPLLLAFFTLSSNAESSSVVSAPSRSNAPTIVAIVISLVAIILLLSFITWYIVRHYRINRLGKVQVKPVSYADRQMNFNNQSKASFSSFDLEKEFSSGLATPPHAVPDTSHVNGVIRLKAPPAPRNKSRSLDDVPADVIFDYTSRRNTQIFVDGFPSQHRKPPPDSGATEDAEHVTAQPLSESPVDEHPQTEDLPPPRLPPSLRPCSPHNAQAKSFRSSYESQEFGGPMDLSPPNAAFVREIEAIRSRSSTPVSLQPGRGNSLPHLPFSS